MESCNIDSTGSKSRLAWTSATEKKNQCTKSAERTTLYDIAKQEYATKLMEGVGKIPVLTETKFGQAFRSPLKEGWALLRPAKKKYRFNEKQKNYLTDKFNIGHETGHKADSEIVAKEMRRARDPSGERMFKISEFLSQSQQISSYFSRLTAKSRQQQQQQQQQQHLFTSYLNCSQ